MINVAPHGVTFKSTFVLELKMVDAATRKAVSNIPQLKTKAGPRDKEEWVKRLKEEYASLISYVKTNKESDTDWFRLESNKEGTRWFGKCWHIQVRVNPDKPSEAFYEYIAIIIVQIYNYFHACLVHIFSRI